MDAVPLKDARLVHFAALGNVCLLNETPGLCSIVLHDLVQTLRKFLHKLLESRLTLGVDVEHGLFCFKKLLEEVIPAVDHLCPLVNLTIANPMRT